MSFGADLKEFTKSFQAGYKMVDDAQLNQKQRELMDADIAEKRGPIDAFNRGRSGTVQSVTSQGTDGSTLTGDLAKVADAIATVESSGQPNNGYGALGKVIKRKDGTEDQALGRFQIMRSNLPSWTKEALGRALTPEEFIKSPQAQDAVFKHRFGGYLAKTGNLGDAASLWHSGRLLADAQDRVDPLGTRTPDYVTRVLKAYGVSPTKPQPPASPAVVGGVPLPPARSNAQPAQAVPLSSGDGYEGEPYDDGSLGFAEGGVIPYGSEDNPEPARALDLSKQPAAASAQPAPQAQDAQPTPQAQDAQPAPMNPFRSLGDALHGGLSFLENHFGLSKQNAALPGTDAKRGEAQQRFMMGEGAASPQEYADVMRTVDPQGQLNDSVRNIAGINAVWEYHLMRGDVQKANASAASLMQYTRNVAAKYGATAIQQLKQGDVQGAAASVQKGYDYTPDGAHLEAKVDPSGNGMARQVDSQSGKVLGQIQVTPQVLMQAAMGLSSGGEYWNQVMEAAQRADPLARRGYRGDQNLAQDMDVPGLQVPENVAKVLGSPTGATETASGEDTAPAGDEGQPEQTASTPEASPDSEADLPSANAEEQQFVAPGQTSAQGAIPLGQRPAVPEPKAPPAFETLMPFPQMPKPPASIKTPSEYNAWKRAWETKNTRVWEQLRKQYDAKVGAEYKFQRQQWSKQQSQAQQDASAEKRAALNNAAADKRMKFQEEQANQREAFREEQKEVDLDRLKPLDADAVTKAASTVYDAKDPSTPLTGYLADMPDPQTGKPFGNMNDPVDAARGAEAATKFLGPSIVRRVRDVAANLHVRGLPPDTAASLATSLVSSNMTTDERGREVMEPNYKFLGLDKAGNPKLSVDGQSVRITKDDFLALEKLRTEIAAKVYKQSITPREKGLGEKLLGQGKKFFGAIGDMHATPSASTPATAQPPRTAIPPQSRWGSSPRPPEQ